MLSVSPSLADMVSIAATSPNDSIMRITGPSGTGFFAAAAINIGASGTVTFTPSDTPPGQYPRSQQLTLTICQTDPSSGACLTTPGPSTTVAVSNGQTVTFTIFATGQGTRLPFIPGINRAFIVATQGSKVVGMADVAVKRQ